MIHGVFGSDVLAQLETSGFDFHLSGSHFFGTNHRFSDWDFYAEYSEDVSLFLDRIGFAKLDAYYGNRGIGFDLNTEEIWRKDGVDVQLVRSAKVKAISQLIIRDLGLSIDKKTQNPRDIKYIWDSLAVYLRRMEG